MQFRNLALAFAISAIGLAQDIDNDEVPPQCQSVCSSIVTLARDCDNTTNDDNAELRCLCNGSNASTLVPLCAACISQNGDRDNDVVDIMTSCSFSRTTWVSSAAATVLSSVSSQSQSQSGSSPATTPVTTTASATQSSDSASATAGAQTSSTGGAPAQTVAAVAGLGALGLALML